MRAFAAVVMSLMLGTCASPPSVLDRILRSGELRVVTRNTPAAFYYGADEPRGIEYELARGFAERLGVGLRIYIADRVYPDLTSRKADIAAASLTVADSRKDTVTFGPAYQDIQPQLIYRVGSRRPHDLADLRGGRLEVAGRIAARRSATHPARRGAAAHLGRGCGRRRRGAHAPRRRRRNRLHDSGFEPVRAAAPFLSRPPSRVQPSGRRTKSRGRCRKTPTARLCARA